MLDAVDHYLEQARQLLGSGHSPTPPTAPPVSAKPATPETWTGGAASAATRLGNTLHTTREQLAAVRAHTSQIISATAHIPAEGHRSLNAIQTGWNSDKAALSPWANTSAGRAALLRAGQQRITETQNLITAVATRYEDAAGAMRGAQLGLPDSPDLVPADDADPANPRRRMPAEAIDEPQSGVAPTRAAAPPTISAALRTTTPLPASMSTAPMSAPSAIAPLTSSIPSAAATLPSLAASAPSAMSPLLQPLSQLGPSSQTMLAARLSPTDNEWSTSDEDPRASLRDKIVAEARRALGLPYVWGGGGTRGPSGGGFDCSGLTQFAVAQATGGQVILPRTTYGQIHCGHPVDLAHARPGDLVFSNFSRRGPEHVQIFAGRTEAGVPMVIEAQQTGVPVKFSRLSGPAVFRRVI